MGEEGIVNYNSSFPRVNHFDFLQYLICPNVAFPKHAANRPVASNVLYYFS